MRVLYIWSAARLASLIKFNVWILAIFILSNFHNIALSQWYIDAIKQARQAYHNGDHQTALRVYRFLSEKGIVEAQCELGSLLWWGSGVYPKRPFPQDREEAKKWIELSARAGNDSCSNLWIMRAGYGDDAHYWSAIEESAQKGSSHSQFYLGQRLSNSNESTFSPGRAFTLLSSSLRGSHYEALIIMGDLILSGHIKEKTPQDAINLYQQAAIHHQRDAFVKLFEYYLNNKQHTKSLEECYFWILLAVREPRYGEEVKNIEILSDIEGNLKKSQIEITRKRVDDWIRKHRQRR